MVSVCLPSDALLQHLLSYLGLSYLRRGLSLHDCSSQVQPLLLTLNEWYLLTAALPTSATPETRSAYWRAGQGQPGRDFEAGLGQLPQAPRATTSSASSGQPKKLEKEPGEWEKRGSISSSSTPLKYRSGCDPSQQPDPGALVCFRLPCTPPRASPNPPELGRSTQAKGSKLCQDIPEADRETGEHCPPATTVSRRWVWGLILNAISPLLPFCWGFYFALGCGYLFLLGSDILLSIIVQQLVVTLEFLQEKMMSFSSAIEIRKPEERKGIQDSF